MLRVLRAPRRNELSNVFVDLDSKSVRDNRRGHRREPRAGLLENVEIESRVVPTCGATLLIRT